MWKQKKQKLVQCTMCTLFSFFSPRPNEVRHILKFPCCHTIQHIFVPARSVEGKMEKNWFPWLSNSRFVILPQIFPCSNYRILAFYAPIPVKIHGNSIIPLYRIQGNFEYRGILLYNVRIVEWNETWQFWALVNWGGWINLVVKDRTMRFYSINQYQTTPARWIYKWSSLMLLTKYKPQIETLIHLLKIQ